MTKHRNIAFVEVKKNGTTTTTHTNTHTHTHTHTRKDRVRERKMQKACTYTCTTLIPTLPKTVYLGY